MLFCFVPEIGKNFFFRERKVLPVPISKRNLSLSKTL